MRQSYTSWVFGVAFSVLGVGSTIQSAVAQTTYTFDATYDATSRVSSFISENITTNTISGESNDAPFGLTRASGLFYIQNDLTSGSYHFSSNPATFGKIGLPLGGVTLSGFGNNKLFYGVEDGTGFIDFTTLTTTASNTTNITGGEGLFQGATGTLTGSEVYQVGNLLVDPTSPSIGSVRVSGTISVLTTQIPEPNNTTALIGMGVIGVGFLLRRRNLKAADC